MFLQSRSTSDQLTETQTFQQWQTRFPQVPGRPAYVDAAPTVALVTILTRLQLCKTFFYGWISEIYSK